MCELRTHEDGFLRCTIHNVEGFESWTHDVPLENCRDADALVEYLRGEIQFDHAQEKKIRDEYKHWRSGPGHNIDFSDESSPEQPL